MAARLLARAPRTERELAERLEGLGYRPETAAATVARCRELGYVDDAALARDRARALRARGHGSLRIEADLSARGVPAAIVETAVRESRDGRPEGDWARRSLMHARLAAGEGGVRAWRHLTAHGFAEETIADVLGEAPSC